MSAGNHIAELKPYPAYRHSNAEWLGDVPEHWEVLAVKQHYAIQLGKMLQPNRQSQEDIEVPYLKALHVQWFSIRLNPPVTMWSTTRDAQQFSVKQGDLLVCEGGEGGRAGLVKARLDGHIIQNALHRVRSKGSALNEYLLYVLFVVSSVGWLDAINNKATIAHFTREKLATLPIPLPPLPEQRAIVRYLDYADRRIRRYVGAKRRLVALLQEERQAVVSRAVTRGLDPSVRLKPSGVEWLGDVPEHWEVRRLGGIATIHNGATPSTSNPAYWEGQILWATPDDLGKLRSRYITQSGRRITEKGYESCGATLAPAGSVALSTRAPIGHLGILAEEGCVNQGCRLLAPHPTVQQEYLYSALSSCREDLAALGQGSTFTELSRMHLTNFPIPLPPLPEQRAIVEHLERETARIDAAIERARRQAALVEEYRTRLVADVVTGKLDVREASASLPDEAEDDEDEPMAEDMEGDAFADDGEEESPEVALE